MRPSFATRWNADLLDENYTKWRENPDSVDPHWAAFFEGFEFGNSTSERSSSSGADSATEGDLPALQTRVEGLVYAYRTLGHTKALLDPLATAPPEQPLLSLSELGFAEKDLDMIVTSQFFLAGKKLTLRELIDRLQAIYCRSIGAEFMHINNPRVRNWVRERIEAFPELPLPPADERKWILKTLMEAESFERFLHTRYVGQKRFSLEGGEALLVILETLLASCADHDMKEIVMGMAHRGRLNVLANFLKKSYRVMFTEFSENYVPDLVAGDGDVKYHLGYEMVRTTASGKEIRITLAANPSHLEAVNPVVEGKARARQRINEDTAERKKVLPLLLHGDAAFAGQGVVAEVLNLSQLPGYRTGGTVHVIVNNQIGFTTLPADARSTAYCTDVAKMIEAPIFHVNGEDPIAVAFITRLALDFRQQFGRDVVIDMYCFRRHGHNEGDEPVFTQPDLYAKIQKRPTVGKRFRNQLIENGTLTADEADLLEKEFEARLDSDLQEVRRIEEERKHNTHRVFMESGGSIQPKYNHDTVPTGISRETLHLIAKGLTTVPDDFEMVPKTRQVVVEKRKKIHAAGGPYDWAFGEALAFGSLLLENIPVRLSGQDSRRGTFSQRHSVLYEATTRERFIPLLNLAPDQAKFCVYNSLLSEAAVLGFDYGYSLDYPDMLCLWEAQFGDFANGAQVIIDQFIVSAESKWQRPSGIVMLLPHGYEGQGPEHSSARMERFLQLCAEDNIQVCNLTTPAQYFHVLRRQMHRPFRKPLIIMTPKSLLRHERAVSFEADFIEGHFQEIIDDPWVKYPNQIDRLVICSGKVYHDLAAYREELNNQTTAVIRLEQIYPFAEEKFRQTLTRYPNVEKIVWCQEESQNKGAWTFVQPLLVEIFKKSIGYAGRDRSSSPAVGSLNIHKREQRQLVEDAFHA